jgi:alpha-beta hydrolase superfamily lysophospholipase
MLETIGNRELIVLDALGSQLRGTYHRPSDDFARTHTGQANTGQGSLGVLFVNSLSLPRAASGDSAVRWADALAERGYPSFRIDLPGLGDSEGNASTDLLDFINAGGFASVAAAAAKGLVDRFQLSGLVIFGHCAGSVSALYTAAASKECKGLILLDPYFHLPQAKRSRAREVLSDWARRSKVGRLLSNGYDRARNLAMSVRGSTLPGNANTQLIARWKQLATTGLPILLLQAPGIKAQGSKPRVGEFDYIEYVVNLASRKSRVAVEFVEGADHSFANREGRQAVQQHMEDWLVLHFPLAGANLTGKGIQSVRAGDSQNDQRKSSGAPADLGCVLEGR